MIRSLVILGSAFFALSAYATPKVGDYAFFEATISNNGQSIPASIELEITGQQSDGKFVEKQTTRIGNQDPNSAEEAKSADEFMNDENIAAILDNCAQVGGTLETLTVPAGVFPTCKMPFDNDDNRGFAWIAKVPFGTARIDSTQKSNGMLVVSVLKAFR